MERDKLLQYGLMAEAVTRVTLPDEKLEELLLAAAEDTDEDMPLYEKIGHIARFAYRTGAAAALFAQEDLDAHAAMVKAFREILDEAESSDDVQVQSGEGY